MKSSNWHGGKGSARRDSDEQAYRDNWDKIFGKHKRDTEKYLDTLKKRGVESADKKHYGDTDEQE